MRLVPIGLGLLLAASVGIGGGVATADAAPSAAADSTLSIGPEEFCLPESGPCVSELLADTGLAYTNDSTSVSVSLVNRVTGAAVAIDYDNYPVNDYLFTVPARTRDAELPTGMYLMTMVLDTMGSWECSEYFEEGCIWFDDEKTVTRWKFDYTAGTYRTVRRWVAPSSEIRKAYISKLGPRMRSATGRVFGRFEQADYSLAPWAPIKNRRVTLHTKSSGSPWRKVASGRTDAQGGFDVRTRVPAGRKYKWKILVASAPQSPGASVWTDGVFRVSR